MSPRISVFLLFASLAHLAHAQGPPKPLSESLRPEARTLYDAGVSLYRKREYAGALAQFTAAYKAEPDSRLLWNMAACEKSLAHNAAAFAFVRRYLDGSKTLSEKERQEAEGFGSALGAMFSTVTIESEPASALVTVDGKDVGRTALTMPLDMGEHVIRFALPAYAPMDKKLNIVGGGAPQMVRVTLERVMAHLRVTTRPAAMIVLDGRGLGVGAYAGDVEPGAHVLEANTTVDTRNYVPQKIKLALVADEHRTLDVVLERKALVWPWLVGGAVVLVAGLVIGSYFLFKVERTDPTGIGTLGAYPLK